MEHVRALQSMKNSVHAVLTDEETWCHWQYMSTEKLNGHRIPKAAETTDPVTCKRCAAGMQQLIIFRMKKLLSAPEVEAILELSTQMVLRQQDRKAKLRY